MIDKEVLNLGKAFQDHWRSLLADYPVYTLDLSWPSVGVVDLLLGPLRHKRDYNQFERLSITGAAAYLGGIAHDCWAAFPGPPKVDLLYSEEPTVEITLKVAGGKYLTEGQDFSVPLVSALASILREPRQPFPYFSTTSRTIPRNHNLVSLFGIGLVTGLCPYGTGAWQNAVDTTLPKNLLKASEMLGKSAAEYYSRVFPEEPLGSIDSLYSDQLILPPAGHREPMPAVRAALMLTKYLQAEDVGEDEMLRLCLNLAKIPDELIQSAGFALAAALRLENPPGRLWALSQALGSYRTELRPAIYAARSALGLEFDWLQMLRDNEADKALGLIKAEAALGLLPFLKLDFHHLKDPHLFDLFHLLSWSYPEKARLFLNTYEKKHTLSADLVLQSVFLDISLGDLERAEADLERVKDDLANQKTVLGSRFFSLRGLLLERQLEHDKARECYETALGLPLESTAEYLFSANGVVRCEIALERYQEALEVIDKALERDAFSVAALANRVAAYALLNKEEELQQHLDSLVRLVPTDRSVFRMLVGNIAKQVLT